MNYRLPIYRWRGKTYQSLRGLHGAMRRAYGADMGLAFEEHAAWLRSGDGLTKLRFSRTFDANNDSIIADRPSPEAAP